MNKDLHAVSRRVLRVLWGRVSHAEGMISARVLRQEHSEPPGEGAGGARRIASSLLRPWENLVLAGVLERGQFEVLLKGRAWKRGRLTPGCCHILTFGELGQEAGERAQEFCSAPLLCGRAVACGAQCSEARSEPETQSGHIRW